MKNQQNKKEQPIKQKIDHQPVSNKIKSDKKTQSKVKPSKKHQSVFNQEFKNSYPKLSKIPLLNRVVFWMYSEGWFYSTTVIIVWLLFLIFGLNHLGKFIITDEPPWLYERIPRYWNSLFAGDLAQTLPTRNPGVTQSLLSGITYLLLDLNDYTSANIDTYLYLWRLPILLFNLLCIIIAYFLLKKLFDKAHALIITGFVAFTPILLGMSQIVNSDSALWSTSFISVIAFLVYLKIPKRKYIWVSGIFMGLALLSKFTATPLYIFLFMYLYLGYLYKQYDKQQFISRTKGLLGIFGISLGVVYVLIPAAWFNLKVLFASTIYPPLLEKTYGMLPLLLLMVVVYLEIFLLKAKASEFIRSKMNVSLVLLFALSAFFLFAFAFVELNSQFTFYSHGKTTISSSGFGTAEFLPNFEGSFYTALRNLTLPVLLSVLVFFVTSFFNPIRKKIEAFIPYINSLLLTILVFYIGVSFAGVNPNSRYQIMMFPLYATIGGIGLLSILQNHKILIVAGLSIVIIEVFIRSPFYICYSNRHYADEYFGKYEVGLYWGMGGYEVAQAVNKMPGLDTAKMLSDYHGVNEFFAGKSTYMDRRVVGSYINQFDYLCLSSSGRGQKQRWQMMTYPLEQYYNQPLDSAVYYIGTPINYIKLVKIDKAKHELTLPNTFDPEYYLDLAKPWSVALWIAIQTPQPGKPILIGKDALSGITFDTYFIDGKTKLSVKLNATDSLLADIPADKNWHNIAWYQTGGNKGDEAGVYIDGVKAATLKLSKDKFTVQKFLIHTMFQGGMDDFRVYDFTLTDDHVKAIYNNGKMIKEAELSVGAEKFRPVQHFTIKDKQ